MKRYIAGVTDAHVREVLTTDLTQAERELWEFDEEECEVSLGNAARVIKQQTGMAPAPASGQSGAPTVGAAR